MLEITVFLDDDDMHQGKRMDEVIMRYLMHHGIMGASVFTAVMGYGQKHHLHHTKGFGTVDEGPLMLMFIDEEEKVRAVLPHIKELIKGGLIVSKRVDRI